MNDYNLTDRQKELLRKLVRYVREEKLREPIAPVSTDQGYLIPFRGGGSLEHQGDLIGDLDALCDAGLMRVRWEKGKRLYNIREAGYDAVDNDFGASLIPELPLIAQPTKEQPDDLSLLEELRDELSVIRTLHFHHPDFQSWHNTVKLSLRQFFGEGSYYVTEYDKIAWRTSDKSEDADEQHNLYLRSCATAEGLLKAAIRTFTVPPSEATATREGTQMPESPPTVFISYAREDLEDARKLYNDLKQAGANPWLDKESLLPGQRWKVEIKRAIRDSRYFLAVLSSNSVSKRGYVHKELAEALDILDEFPESEIFIIPVRLDDCSPSRERLRDLQWVDMFPKWEDGIKRILRAIQVISDKHEEILITLHSVLDQLRSGGPPPTPVSIPSLAIGEWVQWDGLALSVTQYEVTHTCPGGYGQSAEGAKFVIIQAAARNVSNDVIEVPSLTFRLNGYQSGLGAGHPCRYDKNAFGNACWQWSGKLYPDVMCEGWVLFEVPEKLALEKARVRISKRKPAGEPDIAEWRLGGE